MPDREAAAADQARLLDALLGQAPAPAGFDPGDVAFAGRMLREKRARVAAKKAVARRPPSPPRPRGLWARLRAALKLAR